MTDARGRRAAENENFFRRINERVEELGRAFGRLPLVCECSDPACVERLPPVTVESYEAVRARPDRFFVAVGHEREDVEVVVDEQPGYLVVRKFAGAAEVAREDDPRAE